MKLIDGPTPEAQFWDWFVENHFQLKDAPYGKGSLVPELRHQLDNVEPRLMWEIGVIDECTRDFVVSADGIPEVVPAVHLLVDAAPMVPGWRIVKFRPRRDPPSLSREGTELAAANVFLGFTADPSAGPPYDIAIFVPGLTEQSYNALGSVTMVLLDGWLGEEFVMTKFGHLTFKPDSPERSPYTFPLTEAPKVFGLL